MGAIEARLTELGLTLPEVSRAPNGAPLRFAPVRVHGEIAYVSGHGPLDGARPLATGKIGESTWRTGPLLTLEQGRWAARAAGLSMLASLRAELGDLDAISGWLQLTGYVNCSPKFNRTVPVVDGCTELILDLWGEPGVHARTAVGVSELPFDLPVEIAAVVAL